MAKRTAVLTALLVLLATVPAYAVSSNVVISQVYGGGGNSGSTYKNDFIELFNRGTSPVSLSGWSVQYASATGSTWQVTNLSGSIAAGQYYLVQESQGAGGTTSLPTPDATGTILMSATAGKVAVVSSTTALSGTCPASSSYVDLIGFGSTASCYEGAYAPAPSNTNADLRAYSGCLDTDHNNTDFSAGAPNPRNTASPTSTCTDLAPTVASTSPLGNALCVAGSSNVTVTFSEAVNVAGAWYTINCGTSGAHTATVSGGPTTFTLDPDTDFVAAEACTVTIVAAQVTDQDLLDPPDAMSADYAWTFFTPGAGLTPIHTIQGSGASSPLVGNTVTTRGIVTGVKSVSSSNKGFFIQEPDATIDADPATSEGILVFTGSSIPVEAVVGNLLEIRGTVSEFVPSSDPNQPPLSELTSPTICVISTGNPLPAAIPLSTTLPDPTGAYDQLERLEGMRVSVPSLTVTGATLGSVTEADATSTSTGIFFGVVTGVARPFREPGIQHPDPAPSGSIPPIPRWDTNPEVLRVDSKSPVGGTPLDVGTGAAVTGLVGPLDYTYRRYTIMLDPTVSPGVTGGPTLTAAPAPGVDDFTVASFNVARFFDTVNDPGKSDAVLTATAFNNRLAKLSIAVRDYLRFPDIIGFEEVENLATLQTIAATISTDAAANSQPDPQYSAYLVEGNDIGGIDVGFLVKTASAGSAARVSGVGVTQENAGELFLNPDSSTEPLNDRPPLVLAATVNFADGRTYPVAVIANHLRSFSDIDNPGGGSNGWASAGERVRAKRHKQAESLANLIQARQVAAPSERIVVLGDFNAYEFNDGYGDSMATIAGTPTPDNQTVVPGDGNDLVNPDLTNLTTTVAAADRYSYVYDGMAQSLDHVLVNAPLLKTAIARLEHVRINADFADVTRNNVTSPARTSDHDPAVAYFTLDADGDGIADSIDPCNDALVPAFAQTSSDQFQISGTVADCSGVASVALDPASSNLTLDVFGNPGGATRSWRVRRIADNQPCDGTLIAYDSAGTPDPGTFYVGLERVLPVPALGGVALALLGIAVALLGVVAIGRRVLLS